MPSAGRPSPRRGAGARTVVTLDATPLLGRRTGVGRYVWHLIDALAALASEGAADLSLQASTWSARGRRIPDLPSGVRQVGVRTPARLLQAAWRRTDLPPVELLGAHGDVFHGTNFTSPPTRRAREVLTLHDLTYLDPEDGGRRNPAYADLVRRALDRGAHVVTPTRAVALAVQDVYDLPADRVTPTPLGVDASWFDARPAAPSWLAARGIPGEYVVFVGSRDRRKNLDTLLRAHALLRADRGDAPALVLAGPAGSAGPGEETSPASDAGVHRTGWLAEDELRGVVAGSLALVLPSREEGFGLPVLEAMATGRPVLVSDIPALREVGGPHAHAVPVDDEAAMARGLEAVLTGSDDAADLARRHWAASFTWRACAEATLAAYRTVERDA